MPLSHSGLVWHYSFSLLNQKPQGKECRSMPRTVSQRSYLLTRRHRHARCSPTYPDSVGPSLQKTTPLQVSHHSQWGSKQAPRPATQSLLGPAAPGYKSIPAKSRTNKRLFVEYSAVELTNCASASSDSSAVNLVAINPTTLVRSDWSSRVKSATAGFCRR